MITFFTQLYLKKIKAATFLLAIVASLFIVQFFIQRVFAQVQSQPTPLQLTAIPARLGDEDYSLKGKPGELVQTSVQVKNTSSDIQEIVSEVEDFTVGEDGEEPIPTTEENKWNLARWITIAPSVQTLKPSEVGTIDVLIQVPADAPPGGRYAMIMHSPGLKAGDDPIDGGVGISQRVGTLVYFLVEGEIHEEAYLRDIQSKNFFEFGPVPFSFVIENRSDIHLHPSIQVEITNMLGQKSDLFSIESKNIFPGQQRSFSNSWNHTWGFGKYTGLINVSYGTEGKMATGTFSFWIIPLKLILGTIFTVFLFATFAIQMKRKINDTKEVKAEVKNQLAKKLGGIIGGGKKTSKVAEQFKDEHY